MKPGTIRLCLMLVLVGLGVFIFRQNSEIRRLTAENEKLRASAGELSKLRQENDRLAAELDALQKRANSQIQELARLRAKATASDQTAQQNITLKTELERLAQQPRSPSSVALPAAEAESPEVREKKQIMARMSFGKNIALSLIMFADAHDGKLPDDPLAATASLDGSPDSAPFESKTSDYDFLLKGTLYAIKEPGTTILAREKNPIALSDGRFSKAYVFADGHVELIKKNAPGEFAAWEQEHIQQNEQP